MQAERHHQQQNLKLLHIGNNKEIIEVNGFFYNKGITIKLEIGQNYMKNLHLQYNSHFMVNMIQIVERQEDRIKQIVKKIMVIDLPTFISGCIYFDENDNKIYRNEDQTIILVGQFKNTFKKGRWDILHFKQYEKEYKQIGILINIKWWWIIQLKRKLEKIGKWVELDIDFNYDNKSLIMVRIICMVFEQINGIICIVSIMRMNLNKCKYLISLEGIQIYSGGGFYYIGGNQKKIGKWMEMDEIFTSKKQLLLWQIYQSGGGSYDSEGNQKKLENVQN